MGAEEHQRKPGSPHRRPPHQQDNSEYPEPAGQGYGGCGSGCVVWRCFCCYQRNCPPPAGFVGRGAGGERGSKRRQRGDVFLGEQLPKQDTLCFIVGAAAFAVRQVLPQVAIQGRGRS
jgi:hypothetical protein